MASYADIAEKLSIITQYYGAGTIWERMGIDGLSYEQIESMYLSLPTESFIFDLSPEGTRLGIAYSHPFELPVVQGTGWDSSLQGGRYGSGSTFTGEIPTSIVIDPETHLPVRQVGGSIGQGGSIIPTLLDRLSLAVTGVNIGAKLGLKIDELLYSTDPHFWDTVLPTLNPETWASLVGVSPIGDFFLRALFGITDGALTGYISEEALAYYYQMFRDIGAFDDGGQPYAEYTGSTTQFPRPNVTTVDVNTAGTYTSANRYIRTYTTSSGVIANANNTLTYFVSDTPFTITLKVLDTQTGNITTQTWDSGSTPGETTYNGTRYYKYTIGSGDLARVIGSPFPGSSDRDLRQIGTIIIDGSIITPVSVPGITRLPDATLYPPTNITGTTPQQVLQQLRQEYPQLFSEPITETTIQPTGEVTEIVYVPIPWVTIGTETPTATTTEEGTQETTQVDPETTTEIIPETPIGETTTPPPTGEGETPITPVPVGHASSLWAVYNPTQAQLDAFGGWLWSSDFVEQIKKLFADPMQAIIGVHKVFATPSTGGSRNIVCGYLDSGVSSAIVTNQYTTIDCGSASLREYFGSVFDYDPYTKISIFLPFIGVVPLNVADVMRSTISVKYRVDVITGACLAEISVTRDQCGGVLYTYSGSAIVSYPISSGSYVGAIHAALSTALGIGSAIMSGGMSIGASAAMIAGGALNARTQVQHSGQFSGCAGAMGGKKPYLIISRPIINVPAKINKYEGIPSNTIHKLSTFSGFIKVKEVHISSKTAFDNELSEIETLLKQGVII